MYDRSDPRFNLAQAADEALSAAVGEAQYGLFYSEPPQEDDRNGRSWYSRGSNFLVVYSEARPGASFERSGQPDEYMILFPDVGTPAILTAGSEERRTGGYSLIIMPPGDSRVILPNGGKVVRLFSAKSADLCQKCSNSDAYATDSASGPPFTPWPAPLEGYRIRVYSLDVPIEPGQFARMWRCTTLMVSIPPRQTMGRDRSKVSPHSHADFEQGSLCLAGAYQHHMRWPWGPDMNAWHEDVHAEVGSPSVTVIPQRVIHTSTWDEGESQLIDIFAPPRLDFSSMPGWVRNEAEYPMPQDPAPVVS